MNDKNNTGGPAFPFIEWRSPDGMIAFRNGEGMTLRDWFAGNFASTTMQMNAHNCNSYQASEIAKFAYMCADAMIAEREKGGTK